MHRYGGIPYQQATSTVLGTSKTNLDIHGNLEEALSIDQLMGDCAQKQSIFEIYIF